MPRVTLRHENESFESLMRRWKRSVEDAGVLQELRNREFYIKPTLARKKKIAAARKRMARAAEESRNVGVSLKRIVGRAGKKHK